MYRLIKRMIRTILSNLWLNYQYIFRQKQVAVSVTKRNIILFGVPNYPNLGDQAILVAEKKFIEKNFPDANLIMISETDTASCLWQIKSAITSDDLIMYQGGGNTGSLYPLSERNRRFLIRKMNNQRIIIFPQSIFFEDNLVGRYEQCLSSKVYKQNSKLTLAVRENYSLTRAKIIFPTTKCILVPDIVFSLMGTLSNQPVHKLPQKALLVLRDDEESCLTAPFKSELTAMLGKRFSTISTTDTMAQNVDVINDVNRMSLLNEKWAEFSEADLVVTDRLHGMLFAILTERPCLVFANNNHKIESTISTWLQDTERIKLVNTRSMQAIEKVIDDVKWQSKDDLRELEQKYVPLKKVIQG